MSRYVFVFCLLAIVFSPASIFAETLSEYKDNIEHLKGDIIAVLDEDWTAAEKQIIEREFLAEAAQFASAERKIEWQGTTVETDNRWLAGKIIEYKKESKNTQRRIAHLTEIYERLDAIERKITALENLAASNRTKDEDKQKLAEILRREEYQKPEAKQESLFQKIYRKVLEWLAGALPHPNLPESPASGFQSFPFVLQLLLYVLVLSLIGFLIYRFAPFLADSFRRRKSREKSGERVILGRKLAAGETAQTLFDEAEKLAREGDLRGAIRQGYIALLCELSDRKIIGLARHKTNRDYLRDVRQRREVYENMNGLTSDFERHWYGFETADETDWETFRKGYKKIVN